MNNLTKTALQSYMNGFIKHLWPGPRWRHLRPRDIFRAGCVPNIGNRAALFENAFSNHHRLRFTLSGKDLERNEGSVTSVQERVTRSRRVKKGPTTYDVASAWNIANAITVGRIVSAPLTGYWIVTGDYGMALGGLLYAGASDWLDGFLARRWRIRTVIGSYLDPAADKLLISTTTVSLAYQDVIPSWLAVLIIGRDVALIAGWVSLLRNRVGLNRGSFHKSGLTPAIEPHSISKLNTAMQISLSFAGVINAGDWNLISVPVVEYLGLATAFTTTSSGLSYGMTYLRQRSRQGRS